MTIKKCANREQLNYVNNVKILRKEVILILSIKEQRKYFGIYCIECVCTHKKYIGQTFDSFYRRWTFHKWELNNNRHANTHLQRAWNKYGKVNFKFYPIVKFDKESKITIDELHNMEKKYICQYNSFYNGFNLTMGGEGSFGCTMSEEAKRLIGEKNKINMLGKKHAKETKEKMSEAHKGYVKTESHRKNLSKALTGIKRTEAQKEKCRKANQGSKQKTSKYTEDKIYQIKVGYMNGISPSELSIKYDIPRGYIYNIVNDLRWKCVQPEGWKEFVSSK